MLTTVKKIVMILMLQPFFLFAGEFSIRVGANHSWFYYPDESKLFDNEFNPNLSLGLNVLGFSKNQFSGFYGVRIFSVGRFDRFKLGDSEGELKLQHIYLSVPLQFDYETILRIRIYINAEPAYQIQSRYEYIKDLQEEKRTFTKEMKRFNLFLGLGLKYFFTVFKQEFGICGQINYGLFRISKDDITPEESRGWLDWRAREILLNLEYFFHF